MSANLEFDYKKAVQAVNYFALQNGGRINKMKVIKLIYFADRYHIRKYGRPIINDQYLAMPYGPVGSGVKDVAEMSQFLGEQEKGYSSTYIRPTRNAVESVDECDDTVFSESDLEALDFAWDKFGGYDQFELADIAHEYPEWKKHEQALKEYTRLTMSYKDFFDDPPEGKEQCHELEAEEKEDKIAHLKELRMLESLWS